MITCSDNQITEISGISSLRQLTHLSLSDNRLERITNIDNLPLKVLNLVSCTCVYLTVRITYFDHVSICAATMRTILVNN